MFGETLPNMRAEWDGLREENEKLKEQMKVREDALKDQGIEREYGRVEETA